MISAGLGGVTFDPAVLAFDRRQRGTFNKTFEQYAATRVGPPRIKRAKAMMQKHAALLGRVEQRFGVPKELVVAIWTMETDNGADMGKLPVVRTLATLAHDCRRTELFQKELLAALQIVQRGDLPFKDLIGAYAGEIGQTQFLPSSYIKYGVDFDGNGHVDLRRSVPDVLASTANLLKVNGWQPGQPFAHGHAEFRGDARVEPLRGLSPDAALFRAATGRAGLAPQDVLARLRGREFIPRLYRRLTTLGHCRHVQFVSSSAFHDACGLFPVARQDFGAAQPQKSMACAEGADLRPDRGRGTCRSRSRPR